MAFLRAMCANAYIFARSPSSPFHRALLVKYKCSYTKRCMSIYGALEGTRTPDLLVRSAARAIYNAYFTPFLPLLALFCRSVQTEFSVYSSLSIFVLFLKWSKLWSNLILTEKTYYCSHSQENKTSTTKGEITMKNVLKSIRNGIFANYLPTDPIELIAFTARNLILFVAAYVVIRLIF